MIFQSKAHLANVERLKQNRKNKTLTGHRERVFCQTKEGQKAIETTLTEKVVKLTKFGLRV